MQTEKHRLPTKCKGRGNTPSFKTQPLAARGTYRVEAGAATEWRLIPGKLIRRSLELEARVKRSDHVAIAPGDNDFALARTLHAQTITTGRDLALGWEANLLPLDELPPLQHVQKWIELARQFETG